ncbi:MAG: hypothetical protein AAGD05_17570, partial [Bacteroidota bacterium]
PQGMPNGCCENGDFESGNFENWTGGVGSFTIDPNTEMSILSFPNQTINAVDNPNQSPDNAQHRLLSANDNYVDPNIPELPILASGTGDYIVRLGNQFSGNGADRLSYTFTVTACNADFHFNYLLVLEDEGH